MERPVGLITAIPEELTHLGGAFREEARVQRGGLMFRQGRLDGQSIVAVEAGIGKVNAALVASVLCERFESRALVFTGVAGGLDPQLHVGDLVVGRRVICHDYGLLSDERLIPYQPGAVPLPGQPDDHGYDLPPDLQARVEAVLDSLELPVLSAAATGGIERRPRILMGTILTGDAFLNCSITRERLHREFGGHAVEMEGAAVAQVATAFDVPFLVVRALSDLAGEESHMHFPAFASEAAEVAARVVRQLLPQL